MWELLAAGATALAAAVLGASIERGNGRVRSLALAQRELDLAAAIGAPRMSKALRERAHHRIRLYLWGPPLRWWRSKRGFATQVVITSSAAAVLATSYLLLRFLDAPWWGWVIGLTLGGVLAGVTRELLKAPVWVLLLRLARFMRPENF